MPLVYQQNINADTRLAVWYIAEDENFFLQNVPLQNKITHPHKRLQHLAGRRLLTELFDDFPLDLIRIADTRKPFIPSEAFHFSISHCAHYAAAIVSKSHRVGVDIEVPQEKIVSLKHKFLSGDEIERLQQLSYSEMQYLTACWSAKETMFKWYGAGKVDFREHIHLQTCACNDNEFWLGCRFLKDKPADLKVHGLFFNENCLTWMFT